MSKDWQTHDRFLELHSRWMTLIGEHMEDDRGEILEYWRIEKSDSVIVLAIQGDRLNNHLLKFAGDDLYSIQKQIFSNELIGSPQQAFSQFCSGRSLSHQEIPSHRETKQRQ